MSQFCDRNVKSYESGGALAMFARVVLSGGKLAAAGAADLEIGTIETAAFAADELHAVRLRSAAGTTKAIASGAIMAGVAVFGAASGKCTATPNANYLGIAQDAASGDGSIFELLRVGSPVAAPGTKVVEAHTADVTLTAADAGKVLSNLGAAGQVNFTLPAATVGLEFSFALVAAQTTHVLPNGTDQIGTASTATVPATGVLGTAGHGISSGAIGATVHLVCAKAGQWDLISSAGTWANL